MQGAAQAARRWWTRALTKGRGRCQTQLPWVKREDPHVLKTLLRDRTQGSVTFLCGRDLAEASTMQCPHNSTRKGSECQESTPTSNTDLISLKIPALLP